MSHPADSRSPETSKDPRKIGKWARVYAQNRSLGVVVFHGDFSGPLCGHRRVVLFRRHGLSLRPMAPFLLVHGDLNRRSGSHCVSFHTPMGRQTDRADHRAALRRGRASPARTASVPAAVKWIGGLLGTTFGFCILASVVLGFLDVFPEKYMQPISAIYVVPFLVALWLLHAPCRWAYYASLARTLCPARDFDHCGGPDPVLRPLGFAQHAHSHGWLRAACRFNCPYLQPVCT